MPAARHAPLILIAFVAVGCLGWPPAASGQVVRPPDPEAPIAERWSWALAEAGRIDPDRPFWIGYEIGRDEAGAIRSNTGPESLRGPDDRPLSEIVGGDRGVGRSGDDRSGRGVGFLFAFPPDDPRTAAIMATRLRAIDQGVDVGDDLVLWLGSAEDEESVTLLERIHAEIGGSPATEIGPMIAVHENSVVAVPALRRIIESDAPEDVRAEAVAWLGYQQDSPFADALLLEVLSSDASWRIIDEALTSLEYDVEGAVLEALLRLAVEHPLAQVRGEVVQALGEQAHRPLVRATILRIAGRDPDPGVRSEAADVVEDWEDGE